MGWGDVYPVGESEDPSTSRRPVLRDQGKARAKDRSLESSGVVRGDRSPCALCVRRMLPASGGARRTKDEDAELDFRIDTTAVDVVCRVVPSNESSSLE